MTSTPDGEPTADAFLGGRITLLQPRRGYRAGIDPVLLAAAIPAKAGQSVLDLGCGAGAAMFCLAARVPGLLLTGVELQGDYADLARRNAARNGIDARIVVADAGALPPDLRQERFDHVIANPPYYPAESGTRAAEPGRGTALTERRHLEDWIDAGTRRLLPRGRISVIQRADRLPDLLAALRGRVGSLDIRPVQPRTARDAALVIVQGVKTGRAPTRMRAPVILHDGADHVRDGDDYSAAIRAVLRDAADLP